jgi:hypothetical protein
MQFGRLGQGGSLPSLMPSGLLTCEAQDKANIAKTISAGISKYMLVLAIISSTSVPDQRQRSSATEGRVLE